MSAPETYIDCPRAKTWMTPCIARDGHLALADDGKCVGCTLRERLYPFEALSRLSEVMGRRVDPRAYRGRKGREMAADAYRDLVAEYVAPKGTTDA